MSNPLPQTSRNVPHLFSLRNLVGPVGFLFVGLAAGYLLAGGQLGIRKSPDPSIAAQADRWARVREASPVLAIENPPLPFAQRDQQQSNFVSADGSRSDWVIVGALRDRLPYASIQITRRNVARINHLGLIQNLEQLHDLGKARRKFSSEFYVLRTRFGELRATNVLVDADGIYKFCLGFHTATGDRVFLRGLVCSSADGDVAPQSVACMVDSVRFIRTEDENSLKVLLDENHPGQCSAERLRPADGVASPLGGRDVL